MRCLVFVSVVMQESRKGWKNGWKNDKLTISTFIEIIVLIHTIVN